MPTSTVTSPVRRPAKRRLGARPIRAQVATEPKRAAAETVVAATPAPYVLPPSPEQVMQLQQDYLTRFASLWTDFFQNPAKSSEPIKDARFADPAWQSNSLASFYARAYLLNADFMTRLADTVAGDRKTKQRVKFAVSQWIDAASPSNFLATNPQAQQALLESRGESLKSGLDNLMKDMQRGRISQTDETAFEVGSNVATSKGAVVFENGLFQLIQYTPLTDKVFARPFVVVPPCINKYYILDLQPENSFIRHAVSNGHTVFIVSWKNPHQAESNLTWDDYLEQGQFRPARRAADQRPETGQRIGICGRRHDSGHRAAVLLRAAKHRWSSLTMMTALLDSKIPGCSIWLLTNSRCASGADPGQRRLNAWPGSRSDVQ